METAHLTKTYYKIGEQKEKMRSLGTKGNPITSQRISARIQYPNGGILLPEHDMFRV